MKLTLIGKWATDPSDINAQNEYGYVTMEFNDNGDLIYIIHQNEKDQIIIMKYWIDKGVLITEQPSAPRQSKTRFHFTDNGKLVLDYEGEISRFVKICH